MNRDSLSESENLSDEDLVLSEKEIRLEEISGLTGLKNIENAFDYRQNETEIEALLLYLDLIHTLSNGDGNVRSFLVDILGFSERWLKLIHANSEEYYQNMTSWEACENILLRLLNQQHLEKSCNGFPEHGK